MSSSVSRPKAASSERALAYFESLLEFETDCWDVHHVPSAINIPHHKINSQSLSDFAQKQLFVIYCAGPHCNGVDKAAIKLAQLKRPVKKMMGG